MGVTPEQNVRLYQISLRLPRVVPWTACASGSTFHWKFLATEGGTWNGYGSHEHKRHVRRIAVVWRHQIARTSRPCRTRNKANVRRGGLLPWNASWPAMALLGVLPSTPVQRGSTCCTDTFQLHVSPTYAWWPPGLLMIRCGKVTYKTCLHAREVGIDDPFVDSSVFTLQYSLALHAVGTELKRYMQKLALASASRYCLLC